VLNDREGQYLEFHNHYAGIEARIHDLINDRRDLRKKIRDAGHDIKAFDAVRKLIEVSDEQALHFWRDLSQGLMWMGKPLGFQADMFEEPIDITPDSEMTQEQQLHVFNDGRAAAARGASRETCPWVPGSLAMKVWDDGWLQGNEELTRRLAAPPEPPRRSRGRPRGVKDTRPRAARRRNNGEDHVEGR
jgi:hypothetical protein